MSIKVGYMAGNMPAVVMFDYAVDFVMLDDGELSLLDARRVEVGMVAPGVWLYTVNTNPSEALSGLCDYHAAEAAELDMLRENFETGDATGRERA